MPTSALSHFRFLFAFWQASFWVGGPRSDDPLEQTRARPDRAIGVRRRGRSGQKFLGNAAQSERGFEDRIDGEQLPAEWLEERNPSPRAELQWRSSLGGVAAGGSLQHLHQRW